MNMGKKRKSYPRSPNLRIDFKPNTIIYEKTLNFEGKPFTIRMDVKPQKPNAPTIEMHERK